MIEQLEQSTKKYTVVSSETQRRETCSILIPIHAVVVQKALQINIDPAI